MIPFVSSCLLCSGFLLHETAHHRTPCRIQCCFAGVLLVCFQFTGLSVSDLRKLTIFCKVIEHFVPSGDVPQGIECQITISELLCKCFLDDGVINVIEQPVFKGQKPIIGIVKVLCVD